MSCPTMDFPREDNFIDAGYGTPHCLYESSAAVLNMFKSIEKSVFTSPESSEEEQARTPWWKTSCQQESPYGVSSAVCHQDTE